ncbi:MAG: GNAT family N-acetyltransferase [Defluviitaleaceae bacterium]|nr:GNAT family N-acetyltransferase [Defluviitaleaceae bacterium]
MHKKKLNTQYAAEALNVWRIAFAGDEEFDTDFSMKFFNQENLWEWSNCWLDGDKLVSTYFSVDVDLLVRQRQLTGRYVDGLATLPEYQKRGLITKCMVDDIAFCYKNGIDLMLTDPSRDSFYRQVGFEYAIDKYEAVVNCNFFKPSGAEDGYTVKKDILASENLQKDYKVINDWLWENSRYNEMKWPSSHEDIKFVRDDVFIAVAYDEASKPQGYMLYELDDNNMFIISIRFICLKALNALKNHIVAMPDLKYCKFLSIPQDFPMEFIVKEMARPEEAIVVRRRNTRMQG